MEDQIAAGGVVVKKEDDRLSVLLIKDSYGHWTWPKGHAEAGETPVETAVREISEETGLTRLSVLEELGTQEYYFTLNDKKIFKTVHIFLVEASGDEELVIQTSEILEGEWFSPEVALETIEYEGSRGLLEKGINTYRER
ncbi:MAG: NUDIX domain-containing protein [Candidatus Tantalella remota]|nr:NUDIX domain-containing protein [Candidatus Tantalella remota]